MDHDARLAARSDEVLARRLRRRAGEDVPMAPGDLVRVDLVSLSSWCCGGHHHVDTVTVELTYDGTTSTWLVKCLEHECKAWMWFGNTSRRYTLL